MAKVIVNLINKVNNNKMTRRISVNVGGLWRTSVELEEEATWKDLKYKIGKVTGIWSHCQKLEPNGENDESCELEEGDDVFCDWELSFGDHPLHYAAANGDIETIHSWLASGADINVRNKNKTTPLMNACLHLKEECVTELLKLGANTNAIDKYGGTALRKITFNSDLEKMKRIAKILIKAGCDSAIQNNNNETLIDILKRINQNEPVTKLEEWMKEEME